MVNLSKEIGKISSMFNEIAADYDKLNHILSLGIDVLWRKKLVRKLKNILYSNPSDSKVKNALDIACGTGDLSFELCKNNISTIGIDISSGMLAIAEKKKLKLEKKGYQNTANFILASAEAIPFKESSFDAVTISFGIRNFDNRSHCLKEIYRVLNSNGQLMILEFAEPKNILWKAIFNIYFLKITPIIGRVISKNKNAYTYLPTSVKKFPKYENFCKELIKTGFKNVKYESFSGGVAVLYEATK